MGFKNAQKTAIEYLQKGMYLLEDRENQGEKNKLATGEVSASQVIEWLQACRGTGYEERDHDSCKSIKVHIFRVHGWYVKLYFLDPNCYVISVHQ
jgi:hypothetical protein